jgi:hypothetical protein
MMNVYGEKKVNFLIPVIFLWGIVLLIVGGLFWMETDANVLGDYYIIPWCVLAGTIILAPSIYLFLKGKFDFFHPLVFGVFHYILPAFVGGGVILALGWSDPFYLVFVEDPKNELPLSLMYVAIGYLAMTIGFFLPVGEFFSKNLETVIPKWDWKPSQVWIGGILLVLSGSIVNILSFVRGIIGYQKVESADLFDGLLVFMLTLFTEGTILLWLAIFQTKKKTTAFYVVLILSVVLIPLRAAMLGTRSGLLAGLFPIIFAFNYSVKKFRWQHTAIFVVLFFIALGVGIIYGTTFRSIKGSEARLDAGDYFGQVGATVDFLASHDPILILEDGMIALAERVDNLSALGVVVSNYEELAPYEAAYGLENNILNDALYSFVPRFLWMDKPNTSDPRAYSDLYFSYGDNSFAMTLFGDLLRNFGPVGIPIGMMIIGFFLRTIYTALIETDTPRMWKTVAYYPLLTAISYEGFYATLFPSIIRILFVLTVSLYLVNLLVRKTKADE